MKDIIRPGHADFTWKEKFHFVDYRGGGRASGRETASRVASGAIAKKLLLRFGIHVLAYSMEIAGIRAKLTEFKDIGKIRRIIDSNPVKSVDPVIARDMEEAILSAKEEKDSVGGIIEAIVLGVPPGLGEPIFGKLDADLASALLSIPAVKGIEIGGGFELARMKGSEANDEFFIEKGKILTRTNNSGGILGGISDGMPIILRIVVKPTASIARPQKTVNLKTMKETEIEISGRHDPCVVPRAVPVVEAMISLVLADHGLISGFIPRRLDLGHIPHPKNTEYYWHEEEDNAQD